MKKTFRGFTLIELGIVVFAISVLTGIIVPNLQDYITQAEKATDYANAALLYDNVSLIIASDDDAYFSFFNDRGGGRTAQVPVRKPIKKGDEIIGWYWDKSSGNKTTIVTRCSGVDATQEYALAKKMDMMYGRTGEASKYGGNWSGLHDPWWNDNNAKGRNTLYTWEPVEGGNNNDKVNLMDRNKIREKVKNGTDEGEYFTMLLSLKMDMPVWGDTNYGGTVNSRGDSNKEKVDTTKTHFRMRYTGGETYIQKNKTDKDLSNKSYAWEWMITINEQTYEPQIFRGNGQMTLVDPMYPPQTQQTDALDW
jgi:type II secretory pathway pseudopilin PulG